MSSFRPQCVASDGERMFMVVYNPIKQAVKRSHQPVLLLQSQTRPTSFKNASWTVVSTLPSSTFERQGLDRLLDRLVTGESICSIDPLQETFVWITHRHSTKNVSDTTSSLVGLKHSILPGTATWSVLDASRLNGVTGFSETSILFALEQRVFVHAQVSDSGDGIVLAALEGSSFVQSNKSWSLDTAVYGTTRALTYTPGTLYLIGSSKVLTSIPMSTTATDALTLQESLESLTLSTARRRFRLTSLPDECVNPQLYSLHTTADGNSLHILCVSIYASTAPRVFTFDGVKLNGPFTLPQSNIHSNISAFISVKGSAPFTVTPDVSVILRDYGAVGTTRSVTTGMYIIGKRGIDDPTSATVTTPSASPSPIPSSDADDGGQNGDIGSRPPATGGGIAGGVVTALVILLIIYCRFIRKKHLKAKIDRIMQRSEQGNAVSSNVTWTTPSHTVLPPPLPALPPRPTPPPEHIQVGTIPTEEQDLAHIEMQRMQIGPLPALAGSRRAPPLAPPSVPVVIETEMPSSHIGASASTPPYNHSLQQHTQASPYQHYLHKRQQKDLPAQHHLQVYAHHSAHESQEVILGEDTYAQPLHADSASGSSMTSLLLPKSESYALQSASLPDHSQNNYLDHPFQRLTPHRSPDSTPDTLKKDNAWADADSASVVAPVPPPYLVKVTQKLNSPSAPAPLDGPPVTK